jgi:hypothetical protein
MLQRAQLVTTALEQRLRVFQIRRVESLGEPTVDLGEALASFFSLALRL